MSRLVDRLGWGLAGALGIALLAALGGVIYGGPLDPPSAPSATQKTHITSLPYTITAPGSYIVMADLDCPACSTGISIQVDDVILDLNGFALRGGTGHGIQAGNLFDSRSNITVMNGTVSGWGANGIFMQFTGFSNITGVRAIDNTGFGILAGGSSTVRDCEARGNGSTGIALSGFSTLENCHASHNAIGIVGNFGSLIRDCSAVFNSSNGIQAVSLGNVVIACSASQNGGYGIAIGEDGTVQQSNASDNALHGIYGTNGFVSTGRVNISDCVANDNGDDGINVGEGSNVTNCLASENLGDGIEFGADSLILNNAADNNAVDGYATSAGGSRIEANHATDNSTVGYDIGAAANLVVKNTASGNGTNYVIDPLSVWGPIVVGTGGALPAGIHPWANFEY